MALRVAAAAMARSVASLTSQPAVFVRGYATAVDKFSGGPPVQSKRPAYDARDIPHTDKWLEVSTVLYCTVYRTYCTVGTNKYRNENSTAV